MLRSLMIGLDDTPANTAAQELAVRWAKRLGARLAGLAVVDDPGISMDALAAFTNSAWTSAGATTALCPTVRPPLAKAVQRFQSRCAEAGVNGRVCETVGTPHAQLLAEAPRHDVVVLARHGRFGEGCEDAPGQTMEQVLHRSPRPVVVVPDILTGGDSVVVAYDGSAQAARSLALFEASGLAHCAAVHVVSASVDYRTAAQFAQDAAMFLATHGVAVTRHIVKSPVCPSEIILNTVAETDAGLLVMGACCQSDLRDVFIGSVTRTMLDRSPVPLFLFH
jgi:nucleotide-binding universal stress UspA family protein